MTDIKVSVCCIAYNHESYIAEAIESFLMQKTNFEIEILIHDDASTDRTAEIISEYERKYPDIIKSIYQVENQYSKGANIFYDYIFQRANGKYIALCEGDDYWTDPHKLQEQVDYMESNPKCSICVHAAEKISICKKSTGYLRPNKGNKFYSANEVILGGGSMFATNSMLFKTELIKMVPDFCITCPVGDYPLAIYLSMKGEMYYIDKIMSVYRVMTPNSWSYKMNGNLQKEIKHFESIKETLKQVDEYSNYIHTEAISKRILEDEFIILMKQEKYNELKMITYKEIYSKLKFKIKLKIFIKQYFPRFANLIITIRRKLCT